MTPYVQEILQPGETVAFTGKVHWIIYLSAALFFLGGVAILIFGATATLADRPLINVISGFTFVLAVLSAVRAWFARWTTEIAVTDRRIIYKRGFIRRHSIEMNMDKVESIDVDQSILGRAFDYGDVTVRGTGAGLEPLRTIDSPIEFRNCIIAR